jgi:hypothetical protein
MNERTKSKVGLRSERALLLDEMKEDGNERLDLSDGHSVG